MDQAVLKLRWYAQIGLHRQATECKFHYTHSEQHTPLYIPSDNIPVQIGAIGNVVSEVIRQHKDHLHNAHTVSRVTS